MSTRTEFKDDVVLFVRDPHDIDDLVDDSQDEVFDVKELDPESWQDWNSEQLLDVYMSLVELFEDGYTNKTVPFNAFCEFIRHPCPADQKISIVDEDVERMYETLVTTFDHVSFESWCTFISRYSK